MNKAENFWDKASKNYDKTEERFNYIHKKSRENTKRFLKDSDTVLDYGCGTGTASCQFSSLVKDIHAIDISSEMIAISQAKAAHGKIENVNFEQADIFDGKYSKESYDVIPHLAILLWLRSYKKHNKLLYRRVNLPRFS